MPMVGLRPISRSNIVLARTIDIKGTMGGSGIFDCAENNKRGRGDDKCTAARGRDEMRESRCEMLDIFEALKIFACEN